MPICLHIVYNFFSAVLSSWDREDMAYKAENDYYLNLSEEVCQPLLSN